MADPQQAVYDEYVRIYGKPKQAKHLVAYSKKQGKMLKFSVAKRLLLDNMNRDKDKDIKKKAASKSAPKQKANDKDDEKQHIARNNGTKKATTKARNSKEQKANMSSVTNALFGGLSGAIKPLSSIKPIEVTQKMDPKEIDKLSNGSTSNSKKDADAERNYRSIKKKKAKPKSPKKTSKGKKYKKQQGTGSTPKPIAIETKSKSVTKKENKKRKKDKKEPKLRRQLTPIPPPKGKSSVLSLASKFEKEGNRKKDKARKSKRMSNKRGANKKVVNKKQSNNSRKKKKREKEEEKWDRVLEAKVTKWVNLKMEQEVLKLNGGKKYLRNVLENGQLLCRLINKLSPQMIDAKIIKQKANIIRYDIERIESFLECCTKLGVLDDNLFSRDALRSNSSCNMMSVIRTLDELKVEISERERQNPLNLWCSYNEIASDILESLEKAHYDLQKLFELKSDEIEKTLSDKAELSLNNRLKLMKCIVKLKQENVDCDEWILLKEDIYCNLNTKQILNLNNKKEALLLIAPFLQISAKNHHFLLLLFEKYFEEEWFVEKILNFISRLKVDKKSIRQQLAEIFSKKLTPIAVKDVSDFDVKDMKATRLSYNLMELLTACAATDNILHSFIDRYCEELIFHSLCVFLYSQSSGNAYHARIICDFLLDKFPQHLLSAICNNKVIALLFRYAISTQLSHGNLNSFILELVSFDAESEKIAQLKKRVIDKFIQWKYIDYLLRISCSHENYALFLTDLLARCAFDAESHRLFLESHYILSGGLIHELIKKGVANKKLDTFHRITCSQTLCAMLDILKMPTLILSAEETNNNESEKTNYLHSKMFESSLAVVYNEYFDLLSAHVLDASDETQIRINCGVISAPFGPLRFHCLELIGISVDLSMLNAALPLSKLSLSFWSSFFNLLFLHTNNNFFLNQFRRLIHLSMLFRRRILKYLCTKCDLLQRFLSFYRENEAERSELHGFIIQMLWNFYSNDSNSERSNFSDDLADEFDIFAHFEANPEWNEYFMPVIETEMKSRVLTQDIDLNIQKQLEHDLNEEEEEVNENENENFVNDDIFNWNPFREEIIEQMIMPNAEYLSHFGLFRDYRFSVKWAQSKEQIAEQNTNSLYINHCVAQTASNEYYLMFEWCLNKNYKNKNNKNCNNIMIVLDHSYKMCHTFKEEEASCATKMSIICDILCNLLYEEALADNDRIGLISFDHEAYLDFDLTTKHELESQQLRECIENMRLESRECNINEAYYRAIESFDEVKENENESNRILFITTQEPQDLHSLLAHSESLNIATTFISVTREFNLSFQSQIFECRACNYFHLTSKNEANCINFKHVISPCFYDLNLFLNDADAENDDASKQPLVENIFGGMMNDNERRYRCKTGNIQSIRTLFEHSFDDRYRYNINRNEIHLIKLTKNCGRNLKISLQFTNSNQKEQQSIQYCIKLPPAHAKAKEKAYFAHLDIEKAILLTNYINLLKEWIINTPNNNAANENDEINLTVNNEYKQKFKELIAEFEQFENKNDSDLQRELNVICKLANFDQEAANILRDLAQFDR